MAKSNKDVDSRSSYNKKPKPHQRINCGVGDKAPLMVSHILPKNFEEQDDHFDVIGKNPCYWGSFGHYITEVTRGK